MPRSKRKAVVVDPSDNVATAIVPIGAGSRVALKARGKVLGITVRDEIPAGHKFSLRAIAKGGRVIKYGEAIGLATVDIDAGHHVHIHNVESERGRGDRAERGTA